MPNVRLRTIINQDNSTTFQVQFHEGGDWEDLTWDMISDKPFETLDNTVFLVDENGVLTITDLHSVTNWSDITEKPFIFLDPNDFTVSSSGVLSYTGSLDWSSIVGKPFNTLNNNDFEVQNGQLSVRHQTIPNQNWSQIQNKPFTSLDPTNFQVVGGVLYLNINPEIPYWSAIQNKPFTYIDSNDFAVVGDTLKVKHQTIPDQTWSQVQQKPFETLDANDFTVDQQGKVKVNFPQTPTGNPDWNDVQNKPFNSLNAGDFTVDGNGEVSVNFPAPTPDSWQDVTGKPFESIGSGLSVDPVTKELSATGGGGGNPDWQDVQNKPFTTLDSPLLSVYQGGLRVYPSAWFKLEMQNAVDSKIASLNDLKRFIEIFIINTFKYKHGLATPNTGWYCPMCDDNKTFNINLHVRIDNSQTDLTVLSSDYWMTLSFTPYRFMQSSSKDTYIIKVEVNGMPAIINSVEKRLKINGLLTVFGNKTDGNYTNFKVNSVITDDGFNMYIEEVSKYTSYIQ